MKESTKGVLLSGLVYPGLGQFVLEAKFSELISINLSRLAM